MAIIGREPPADIVFPAAQVSARHAEIVRLDADVFQLTDLGSTNGTFVNGQRVASAQARITDAVSLGSYSIDMMAVAALVPSLAPAYVPLAPPPPHPAPYQQDAMRVPDRAPAPAPQVQGRPNQEPRFCAAAYAQPGMGTELAVALAAQKSFTGKAFFAWFLYWLFWFPGAVMTLVFLSEASRVQRMTGVSPPGKGCLTFLLITHIILPVVGIVVLFFTGAAVLHSLLGGFR